MLQPATLVAVASEAGVKDLNIKPKLLATSIKFDSALTNPNHFPNSTAI